MPKKSVVAAANAAGLRASPPPTNLPSERWTPSLVEAGFIPVARSFLRLYAKLQPPLTTSEAILVVHLMDFKRDERHPYPSYKRLGSYMGVSDKAIRKTARNLQNKGYLRRVERTGTSSLFDLRPLFRALEALWATEKTSWRGFGAAEEQTSTTSPKTSEVNDVD